MAIHSAVCTSISEHGAHNFVDLKCDNGMKVSLMFSKDEPCGFQFKGEYSIEIAPVYSAVRQIKAA